MPANHAPIGPIAPLDRPRLDTKGPVRAQGRQLQLRHEGFTHRRCYVAFGASLLTCAPPQREPSTFNTHTRCNRAHTEDAANTHHNRAIIYTSFTTPGSGLTLRIVLSHTCLTSDAYLLRSCTIRAPSQHRTLPSRRTRGTAHRDTKPVSSGFAPQSVALQLCTFK